MKKIITLLLILVCYQTIGQTNTCPTSGDNKNTKHVDSMKNRNKVPTKYYPIEFYELSNLKATNTKIKDDSSVSVIGYITDIKDGGSESCNCHSLFFKDTHIYLSSSKNGIDENAIIVEVTPRFREKLGTTDKLKVKYLGKKVQIFGYLFKDEEHKANSTVDLGKGIHWRHTVWEIHPVTLIKILP